MWANRHKIMDKGLEEIKELLDNDYRITDIKYDFKREDANLILSTKVVLKKDTDTKEVSSKDSPEFFNYVSHLKPAKEHFVYVEDLEYYDRRIKPFNLEQVYSTNEYTLKISGRVFKDGVTALLVKPGSRTNNQGFTMFLINLEVNPDFLHCDLKDEVEILDKDGKGIFRGLTKDLVFQKSKEVLLIFQDATLKMEHIQISAEIVNMLPSDSVGLITSSIGFNSIFHQIPHNTQEREFVVIVPVKNLIINESFKMGDVEFYQNFNTQHDALIRKSNNGLQNLDWNGNIPRAKITINADQFYPAIVKGYKKISSAVDVIAFQTDLSFPTLKIGGSLESFNFNYFDFASRVKISTWAYCKEKENYGFTIFNTQHASENRLSLDSYPQNHFLEINKITDNLLKKENLAGEETSILNALHWLRRAIQIGDNKDKLLDLWTSMEFLTSYTRLPKIFKQEDINAVKDLINQQEKLKPEQKDAIIGKFNMLNDAPLMGKVEYMLSGFGIVLSEEEKQSLRQSRKKRNELIHGHNNLEIKDTELNKLRSIIERLIIGKLNELEV